jgi:hypothetical protein
VFDWEGYGPVVNVEVAVVVGGLVVFELVLEEEDGCWYLGSWCPLQTGGATHS